jgi:hypothetical protein
MSTLSAEAVDARMSAAARGSGLTRARLAWLQATGRRRWAVSLWLCLAAALAVPALLPLIEVIAAESALADTIAQDGSLTVQQNVADVDAFSAFERKVDATVTGRMGANVIPLAASATAGPFFAISLNAGPVRSLTGRQGLTPTYLDHLAAHVSSVAGELPPEGLGGGDIAVTMPQSGADQLGLHLSDRFCVEPTVGRQPSWCARLVGLWRPADPRDPYWGGTPPRTQLAMGRYDFFKLIRLLSPLQALAGLRYQANSSQIDTREAASVSRQVRQVSSQLRGSGFRVVTSLDRSLERFVAAQRAISSSTRLVAAAVPLLALLVVALVSARFLDGQTHDLGVLLARGWSRRRAWRLAFAGPAALAALALPAGLASCAAIAAASSFAPSRTSLLTLRLGDLVGPAAVVAATFVGVVAVLAFAAARAAPRDPEPPLELPFRRRRTGWRGAVLTVLLALLGGGAVFMQRLPGFDQLASGLPVDVLDDLLVVPALGLALLAAAIVRLRLFRVFAPRRRANVSRLLAAKQVERYPEQHTALALILDLSAAIGVFAAIALVIELTMGPGGPPAVRSGAEVGLVAGALAALTLALAAFAFHFRWAARRRLTEYGGLFAHGLATAQVGRSLAAEQSAIAGSSLLAGAVLGAALALAVLPLPTASQMTLEVAALGAGAFMFSLLVGTLAVGSVARRLPARVNPLPDQWQW